mmetsp:Transcript_52667/g.128682  ORF Transcript_52667/g.128682 Transcript_52667/m.128682 type:complete len:91 (-) Transcript_52667:203-475(-)
MSGLLNEVVMDIKGQRVPSMTQGMGVLLLLVNIFLPGIGSIIAGLLTGKMSTAVIGILQFVLAFCIIGWLWSIWWGVLFVLRPGGVGGVV